MSLIPLVLLLLLIVLFIRVQPKSNRLVGFVILVSLVLVICLQDVKENFLGYADLGHQMGQCSGLRVSEDNSIGPLIQSHDGIRLSNKDEPSCGWRKSPCHLPLVTDTTIYSPVGDGIRLTEDPASSTFPTIEGVEGGSKHLFMLAQNQCRPECCPGTYSCDRGCICTTAQQRKFINTRGGNRTNPVDPQI